jgi:hypothetical protein
MEGTNHLFDLGLKTRHRKLRDAWRKDLHDLRHNHNAAVTHETNVARRLVDADVLTSKAQIKEFMLQRLVDMYPFVFNSLRIERKYLSAHLAGTQFHPRSTSSQCNSDCRRSRQWYDNEFEMIFPSHAHIRISNHL